MSVSINFKLNTIKCILILILSVFLSCKTDKTVEVSDYKNEISALTTDDEKKIYLEKIFSDDLKVRNGKDVELMLKYGKDSKEVSAFFHAQLMQDSINVLKVEKYLEVHGHPSKEMGSIAASTPWTIIHHSQGYDTRVNNFKTIYLAYLEGHISNNAISFYLGRMYRMKNGKSLDIESPYKPEDELDKLITELNLSQLRNEVLISLEN